MLSDHQFQVLTSKGHSDASTSLDSDCACADIVETKIEAESPTVVRPRLMRSGLHAQSLGRDHFLVCNTLSGNGPAVLNQPSFTLLNWLTAERTQVGDFHEARTTDGEFVVERFQTLGLLDAAGTEYHLYQGDAQTLVAWLHVTNACNLTCTYCYVDKSDEPMDEATGYAAVDAIFRSARQGGFQAVKLKYAGGEATLNFGLVMKLHDYAVEQARKCGLGLKEVVLSNGVALTRRMLDFLREESITLSLSLDGLGQGHDNQRIFANGKGSAWIVQRSIERALAHGVKPHLSITVTGNNTEDVAAAVEFALTHDLLFNLNFYRESDATAGEEDLRAQDVQLIAGMRRAFAVIEANLPGHSLLASLLDRANLASPHETACAAGNSYVVVDHRGRISRCQMEMNHPVSSVHAPNPLDEILLHSGGFQSTPVDERSGCRDCEWRYWCAGGCPSLTYRVTGRNDVKSPYCNVYKAMFPDMLRLEGLRILKENGSLL